MIRAEARLVVIADDRRAHARLISGTKKPALPKQRGIGTGGKIRPGYWAIS
jgi:hypothetical protein